MSTQGQTMLDSPADWDLLLFSDVHLGSDLRRTALQRSGGLDALRQREALDRALGALLDHYAAEDRRWRLVLAGDIIDFISINVTPSDVGERAGFVPTADEEQYGLEPGPERCAWMMRLVLRRHPLFFERLAAFLARGNDVVIVRGNHDAALLWPDVQRTFLEGLLEAAERILLTPDEQTHIRASVRFEEWFYLEPGRIYVEHGHLHDSYSAEPDARNTDARRPDRLNQPVSTLILRYFCNRFPSLDLDLVDTWNLTDFVRWAFVKENPFVVGWAFVKTVLLMLLPFWRRYLRQIRRNRALAQKAQGASVDEEITDEVELASRVRSRLVQGAAGAEWFALGLARLVRRAARVGAFNILQVFYLDRIGALALGIALGACSLMLPASWLWRAIAAVASLAAAIVVERWCASARDVSIAPKLHAAAESLSRLIEVPIVVMGHSHRVVDTLLGNGRTRYVNLGSWASAAHAADAGCPHLVLRRGEAQLVRGRVSELVR